MATYVRSDEPLTLRPSPRKWVPLILGAAVMTAASVMLVRAGVYEGWLGIVFFGPGVPLGIWILLPGTFYLRLSPTGFVAKTLFRTLRYEWDAVDNFHVHTVKTSHRGATQTTHLVAFDTKAQSRQKFSLLGRLFGERIPVDRPDGALPDTYGRNPSELVQLLRSYHDRYATGARGG